ncbi:hypothetical protein IWZ01DRAFT_525321 [Phyllosticta capitalensis]
MAQPSSHLAAKAESAGHVQPTRIYDDDARVECARTILSTVPLHWAAPNFKFRSDAQDWVASRLDRQTRFPLFRGQDPNFVYSNTVVNVTQLLRDSDCLSFNEPKVGIIDENATRLSTLHCPDHWARISQRRPPPPPPANTPSANKIVDSGGASDSSRTSGLGSLNGTFEHDVPGSRPRDSLKLIDTGAPPANTPSVNKVVDSGGASDGSRTSGLGSLNGTFEHDVPGSRPRDSLKLIDTGAPPANTPSVNKVVDSGGASDGSRTLGLGSLNDTFEHDVPASGPRDSLEFNDTFEHDIPGCGPRDSLEFIDTFECDIPASRSSFNDTPGSESSHSTTFPARKFHTSGAFVDDVPASRSYTSREAKSTSILGKLNKTETVSLLSREDSQTQRFQHLSSPGNKLSDLSVLIEEKRVSSNVAPSSKNRIQSANVTPSRKRSGSIMAKPTEKRVYTGRVTPSKNVPTRTTRSTRAKAKALTPDARRLLRMFKPSE